MSHVANVLVKTNIIGDPLVDDLNERLQAEGLLHLGNLTHGTAHAWGGGKAPEIELLAGAYNYLDIETFLRVVREWVFAHPFDMPSAAGWVAREDVQVLIQDEHEQQLSVWELDGSDWVCSLDHTLWGWGSDNEP